MPAPCPVGIDVARAAEIVRGGGLVALPTETVYGLGGDALSPLAVARIFEAKRRPHFDPLIVHIPDVGWLPRVVARSVAGLDALAAKFWPGPLTLVLPKTTAVPDLVTSGLSTVAVRIPSHPMALALLRAADRPIAAPSANLFGSISPTTSAHVLEQLGERIDYILEGGPCAVGVESTVLQLPDTADPDSPADPTLLRPGGLALEDLEAVIGPIRVAVRSQLDESAATSPGMLARHYAPRTPLTVLEEPAAPRLREMSDAATRSAGGESHLSRVGLLTFEPIASLLPSSLALFGSVEVLSREGDLREAAANFFAALRRLDDAGLDRIFATPFPGHGLGRALNDRLRRAAAPDETSGG